MAWNYVRNYLACHVNCCSLTKVRVVAYACGDAMSLGNSLADCTFKAVYPPLLLATEYAVWASAYAEQSKQHMETKELVVVVFQSCHWPFCSVVEKSCCGNPCITIVLSVFFFFCTVHLLWWMPHAVQCFSLQCVHYAWTYTYTCHSWAKIGSAHLSYSPQGNVFRSSLYNL